jgi:hypothetical protein
MIVTAQVYKLDSPSASIFINVIDLVNNNTEP